MAKIASWTPPNAFKLSFADQRVTWFGQNRSGMPIIRWPSGKICQPLIFFFGYMFERNLLSVGSMEIAAYTLREWFAFLEDECISWFQATDITFHRWSQKQKDEGIKEAQIEVKLRRLYHFYLHIPDAMTRLEDGSATPEFVGENTRLERLKFPISTKQIRTKNGEIINVWSGWKPIKTSAPALTVLPDSECRKVLDELRYPLQRAEEDQQTSPLYTIKRERDWAMGRLMAGGGLRAAEVPALSLVEFTAALADEGLLTGLGERGRKIKSVAELDGDKDAQEVILKAIKHYEQKRKRLYIGVKVTGKGNKERKAGFLVDLVQDLLTVIIWGSRAALIKHWRNADPNYNPDDTLFLSFKTNEALTAVSVSDIMLRAFHTANVAGSGHDLRKNYATNLAAKILRRNLDRFGFYTHAVLNTVLSEVADALGHKTVNTTTQHYTNLAVVHSTGIESSRKRSKIMNVWELLLQSKDVMDDERIRLCGTAVKVFAELPKDTELFEILAHAMSDPEMNPGGLIILQAPTNAHLRLVADNTTT